MSISVIIALVILTTLLVIQFMISVIGDFYRLMFLHLTELLLFAYVVSYLT